MNAREAAERVGVPRRTIVDMGRRGIIPTTRAASYPHAMDFRPEDVDAWAATYAPGRSKIPLVLRGNHVAQVQTLVEHMPSGCIEFRGYISPTTGYGQVGQNIPAHRVAYEAARGPIPTGFHIDHLCRNIICVNPDHLEPVTIGENVARGMAPTAVAHRNGTCTKGHRVEGANAYLRPNDGRYECMTCRRARSEAWNERQRAERRESLDVAS